jgi:conjugative relaxase-like TrwC/TraI family protein
MLTIGKNADPEYYNSLLESRDRRKNSANYYEDGAGVKEPPGRIYDPQGIFGLEDGTEPGPNTLNLLIQGRDPCSGSLLPGLHRTGKNKGRQNKRSKKKDAIRTESFDLTFSAPKSVSLLLAWSSLPLQEQIIAAQEAAVRAVFEHFQTHLCRTRLGKDGVFIKRAKMGAVQFTQLDARPTIDEVGSARSDPNLHTHNVVPNAVLVEIERDDGSIVEEYRTLDAQAIFNNQHSLDQIYKAELSQQLCKLGIKLRRTSDKRGLHSFEVEGFDRDTIDLFSKRAKEVDDLHEAMLADGHSEKYAKRYATTNSRKAKTEETLAERDARWKAEAKEHGFDASRMERIAGDGKPIETVVVSDEELFGQFVQLIQTKTVITHDDLWSAAADVFVGRGYSEGDIANAIERIVGSGIVVPLDDSPRGTCRYVSTDLVVKQFELESLTDQLANTTAHPTLLSENEARAWVRKISDDIAQELGENRRPHPQQQELAVRSLSCGQLASVEGGAGTGKTTSFDIVCRVLAKTCPKSELVGTAIANSVSKALAQDLKRHGIAAENITSLLLKLRSKKIKLTRNSIVLVDESSMVDVRQMSELVRRVKESGARIILTGDRKQLSPVAAGHSLRVLDGRLTEKQRFRLDEIQRQQTEEQKAIVRCLENGRSDEAINRLKKAKSWHLEFANRNDLARQPEGGVAGTLEKVVTAYFEKVDNNPNDSVGIFSPSNLEVRALGTRIREELRRRGVLKGTDRKVRAVSSAGETYDLSLAVGDQIVFMQREPEIHTELYNGARGVITAITGRSDHPEKISVSLDFETPNGKFSTTFKLADLMDEERRVRLAHSYAMTTHKGQGKTVDHSIVSAAYGVNTLTAEMAYVLGSRHRKTQEWFINAAAVRRSMLKDNGFRYRDVEVETITDRQVHDQIATAMARRAVVEDAKHEFLSSLSAQRKSMLAALNRIRAESKTSSKGVRSNLEKLHAYATGISAQNDRGQAAVAAVQKAATTERREPMRRVPAAANDALGDRSRVVPKDEPEVLRQRDRKPTGEKAVPHHKKSSAERLAELLERRAAQINRLVREGSRPARDMQELKRHLVLRAQKYDINTSSKNDRIANQVRTHLARRINFFNTQLDVNGSALKRQAMRRERVRSYQSDRLADRLMAAARGVRSDLSADWIEFEHLRKQKKYDLLRIIEAAIGNRFEKRNEDVTPPSDDGPSLPTP